MGLIVLANTFLTNTVIDPVQVNENFNDIYGEFNGNIDNSNIKVGANIDAAKLLSASIINAKYADSSISDSKLDYGSVEVLRTGPIHPGGNGHRVASGGKAFTLVAGSKTITITFATDSDDGNPVFSAAPRLTGTVEVTGTVNTYTWYVLSRLASAVSVVITSSFGTDTISGTFHWIAKGTV